ncbi:CynX/NimT family MFS transporter [Paenibacillus sp. GCM10027626]|uniref:CynX/NimT family MFS transporter n=1 Tax=Paenibacillus sp. GCM10027626 TaxID=3273411 RepID=UPI0036272E2C
MNKQLKQQPAAAVSIKVPRPRPTGVATAQTILLVLGIVLIALNLRAPLTAVGPLIGSIREAIGLSNAVAGTLTTVPLLAFALLSPFAPALARKLGVERLIMYALCLLTLGIVVRSMTGAAPLFGGTVLLGLGIAVCNVMLPSIVKRDFPQHVGIMTGVYAVAMNLCGAAASGLSVPIARDWGLEWNGALGFWCVPAVIAVICWLPQLRRTGLAGQAAQAAQQAGEQARQQTASMHISGQAAGQKPRKLWRSPLAWQVTLAMGLQSFIFYIVIAWFPQILIDRGMDTEAAGWTISIMQFALLPITFIVPIVAAKMKNQHLLVVLTGLFYIAGIGGFFMESNDWVLLWAILLGIAGGCSFSLSMMFFSLRTRTAGEAARLSGMAQAVGYLLAAGGPMLFGVLHDSSGGWRTPLIVLLAASIAFMLSGFAAGRNRTI